MFKMQKKKEKLLQITGTSTPAGKLSANMLIQEEGAKNKMKESLGSKPVIMYQQEFPYRRLNEIILYYA